MSVLDGYPIDIAADLAGFRSVSMLDYLVREGIVTPSVCASPGRGRPRRFSFGDVVLLRALNRLLASGLPVRRLRSALATIQSEFQEIEPEDAIHRFLVTDGSHVLLVNQKSEVVDLTIGAQMAFAFLVDVKETRAEVVAAIENGVENVASRRKRNTS